MPEQNNHAHESFGPSEDELKASIDRGYEAEDISLSVLIKWGLGLGIGLIIVSAVGLLIFRILLLPQLAPAVTDVPLLQSDKIKPPPGTPVVQAEPVPDIKNFRRDEELKMNEYARVDGKIHIPVGEAMKLVLKEGLPVQKSGEAPTGVTPTSEMKLSPAPALAPNAAAPRSRTDTQGAGPQR